MRVNRRNKTLKEVTDETGIPWDSKIKKREGRTKRDIR